MIKLKIGEDYMETLRGRLSKYDISHGALARQMGIGPSQVSRWFNRVNPTGKPMSPTLSSVYAIEQAIVEILHSRRKKPGRKSED